MEYLLKHILLTEACNAHWNMQWFAVIAEQNPHWYSWCNHCITNWHFIACDRFLDLRSCLLQPVICGKGIHVCAHCSRTGTDHGSIPYCTERGVVGNREVLPHTKFKSNFPTFSAEMIAKPECRSGLLPEFAF